MGETRIDLKVADGVAWITLDGPARRNALDRAAVAELIAACDAIDADATVGVAVVTGAGWAFCSGGDTAALERIRTVPLEVRKEELAGALRGLPTIWRARCPDRRRDQWAGRRRQA